MTEQEKRALDIESIEATELEDEDLEDVSGGDNGNCSCPSTNNCPSLPKPGLGGTDS